MLDFGPDAPLRAVAQGWSDRMAYVACGAKDTLGLSAMLVRPDGFVAWAAEGEPDAGEAARAAFRWFGAPR